MSSLSGDIDFASAIQCLKDNLIAVYDSTNANVLTGFTNRKHSSLSGGTKNFKHSIYILT